MNWGWMSLLPGDQQEAIAPWIVANITTGTDPGLLHHRIV